MTIYDIIGYETHRINYVNIDECERFGGFSYTDEDGSEVCLDMRDYNGGYVSLHNEDNGQKSVRIHIGDFNDLRRLLDRAEAHLRDAGIL